MIKLGPQLWLFSLTFKRENWPLEGLRDIIWEVTALIMRARSRNDCGLLSLAPWGMLKQSSGGGEGYIFIKKKMAFHCNPPGIGANQKEGNAAKGSS